MSTPELVLLGGMPWSGKSSIGRRFVELGQPEGARHLPIGDHMRSIIAGDTPSAYADMLKIKALAREHGSAPSEAIVGIFEEFIQDGGDCLTIVDGFPRYRERIPGFKESLKRIGAAVLAICVVNIDNDTVYERSTRRQQRSPDIVEDRAFVERRLDDHQQHIAPTLEALAQEHPSYIFDGALPIDTNVANLLTVYKTHSTHT